MPCLYLRHNWGAAAGQLDTSDPVLPLLLPAGDAGGRQLAATVQPQHAPGAAQGQVLLAAACCASAEEAAVLLTGQLQECQTETPHHGVPLGRRGILLALAAAKI